MDLFDVLRAGLSSAFGPYAIMLALAAIGLNVHFGYTGLLNFGQAGFMAVAGYGMAVSVTVMGLPFGVGLVVALIAPIVLALLLGAPTLRLRADYLAIATIAAAEILRLMGVGAVRLLTNNPAKVARLQSSGIEVTERVPLRVGETPYNEDYLATKAAKSGHIL